MKVELLDHTSHICMIKAIRRCHNSEARSDSDMAIGPNDQDLIRRIIAQGHTSTLEHLVFVFDIDQLSRAALQEFARHRIASPSVKSTRYTMQEIKDARCEDGIDCGTDRCGMRRFLHESGSEEIDFLNCRQLCGVAGLLHEGLSNDVAKYGLPEVFRTSLIWTINARSLRNFFTLRSSPRALREMRHLADEVFAQIPADYRFLFEDCMEGEA